MTDSSQKPTLTSKELYEPPLSEQLEVRKNPAAALRIIRRQQTEIEQLRTDLKAAQTAWNAACNTSETVVTIPPRPRSLQSGWLLTGSQISQEQALQAFVAHADAAHDEIIRLWRENARMRSQLQQETGVCPHGKPLALSECLSCVGTNAQKASEQRPLEKAVCKHGNGPTCFECSSESEGER